jgi:hypothetical protein
MILAFGFIAPKTLNYLSFHFCILSVPDFELRDEDYFRNMWCTLNVISTLVTRVDFFGK